MLTFIHKYRQAVKGLIDEKSYIEAAASVFMFPALYGFNVLIGETDPDDKPTEDPIEAKIKKAIGK